MRTIPRGPLNEAQRSQLLRLCRSESVPYRVVVRSWIVLLADSGKTDREIGRLLRVTPITVARWRARFALFGIDGLRRDAPRTGAPSRLPRETVRRILDMTQRAPPPGRGRWTTRTLAREVGVSHTSVRRVWNRYRLRPTAHQRARIALRPGLRPTRIELEGVYVNPPRFALALSTGPVPPHAANGLGMHAGSGPRSSSRSDDTWILDLMGALDKLERGGVSRGSRRFADQELLRFVDALGPGGWNRRINLVVRVEHGLVPASVLQWLTRRPWVAAEVSAAKASWRRRIIEVIRDAGPTLRLSAAPLAMPGFLRAVSLAKDPRTSVCRPFVWIRGR